VAVTEDRSAALLIRVWFENGPEGMRARLTAVEGPDADSVEQDRTVALAATPRDVLDAVRRWLEDVGRRGSTTD